MKKTMMARTLRHEAAIRHEAARKLLDAAVILEKYPDRGAVEYWNEEDWELSQGEEL